MRLPFEQHVRALMSKRSMKYVYLELDCDKDIDNPLATDCLFLSCLASFHADISGHEYQEVERFFSTWTTNLLGPDLQKLKSISQHPWLRSFVKRIHIEVDCEANDSWNTSEPLRSEDIWPRDDSGNVRSSQINVASLRWMLEQRLLQPETLKVRDYLINQGNFMLCPETTRTRDYRIGYGKPGSEFEAVSALARDLTDEVDIAIISVDMKDGTLKPSDDSIFKSGKVKTEGILVGPPRIIEVSICLCPEYQGQGVGLSMLRSALLRTDPYWTDLILGSAPKLEDFEIWSSRPVDRILITEN